MLKLRVKITFTEELLGTANSDPNVHADFIASKSPDAMSREEEVAALGVKEFMEKAKTVFPRNENGGPILWDYQIKGFFKDTCAALRKVKDTQSSRIKAFKKEIDGLIFPEPRKIPIVFNGDFGDCQRPLRAQAPQGERIALVSSETIPAGATAEFDIVLLSETHKKAVLEWLDYGKYRGMGQWRNSGKGRFTYELLGEE